jgi:hypothetical protein
MFYVLSSSSEIELDRFRTLNEAKRYAEARKAKTGSNYIIEERLWVWSTATLDEIAS